MAASLLSSFSPERRRLSFFSEDVFNSSSADATVSPTVALGLEFIIACGAAAVEGRVGSDAHIVSS
jgi:hypothetical protein